MNGFFSRFWKRNKVNFVHSLTDIELLNTQRNVAKKIRRIVKYKDYIICERDVYAYVDELAIRPRVITEI